MKIYIYIYTDKLKVVLVVLPRPRHLPDFPLMLNFISPARNLTEKSCSSWGEAAGEEEEGKHELRECERGQPGYGKYSAVDMV